MDGILISGFSDEISLNFDTQLQTVSTLGMEYISLRTADGRNIADFTAEEVKTSILPRLERAGVAVSSLGSPIGKVAADDEAGFVRQLGQLDTLCEICKLLHCNYIRIFSFYIPEGADPDSFQAQVVEKLTAFVRIAARHGVILIHENEKDIFGDTGLRCRALLDEVDSPNLKAAFDFANFVQCGEDPVACWELLHDRVAYIHIKDAVSGSNENVLCGTGEGHIPQLLRRAIRDEGYHGFLTLEPHLVLFDALQSLELKVATDIIAHNKAMDGAEGYAMQYRALRDILAAI